MFRRLRRSKEKKPEWSKHDDKVLQAVRDGDTGKLQHALTKKGTSPTKVNREGQTALHVAASSGQLQSLEILLALGANVHIRDNNGIVHLKKLYYPTILVKFIDPTIEQELPHGIWGWAIRKPVGGMTALHHASRGGYRDVAARLLQAGSTVDMQDNCGQTALHHAAVGGHVDCTVLLVQAKASRDTPDDSLKTPLLHASELGHAGVCKELIDRGSAVNAVDNLMKTPLIHACENGHREVVDLLVKRGAKVDAQDAQGHDAAFYAADNPDISKSLESAPPVATWDIKSADEDVDRVKPDAVDYVDAFNSSGDDEAGGHRGSPSAMDEMATPSRALSMPTLTAANNENENEKVLHELEEENEMLNEEVQGLQVTNRRQSEKIKKLEAQLQASDVEALQAQLKEEREKNRLATQEIKTLKEVNSKTSFSEDDGGDPASWGDTDDDDLFDLPGLGTTTTVFQKSSSKRPGDLTQMQKENENLRMELKKAAGDISKVKELERHVEELQSRLSAGGDHKRLLDQKEEELSISQAATRQLREEVATLNKMLAQLSSEKEEMRGQERLPTFEPSPSSPRFHRLLQEKAHLEKKMKQYQELSEGQKEQLLVLQAQMARTNSLLEGGGGCEGGVACEEGVGISPQEQEDLMDRLEESTKETARLQAMVTKQSKAIAQQTDRARKDKLKYSELLAENESLRKIQSGGSGRGQGEAGSEADLLKKCQELDETVKQQERLLTSRADEHNELLKMKAENTRLEEKLRSRGDQLAAGKENGGGDRSGNNVSEAERQTTNREVLRGENEKLKFQLAMAGGKGSSEADLGGAEEFAQLSIENEALGAKVRTLSAEVDFLRTAQGDYSKRKYTEVLLENRRLKESLHQGGLPNGDVKHSSKDGEVARGAEERAARAEADRLREKLDRMEARLEDTVNVYRQHLLNAVQGNMDPAIKEALMQIIKLRSTSGGSR